MEPAATSCRTEGTFRIFIWAGLYCVPLIAALSPHVDQDLWWHLRTGQMIVEEQRIPTTDSFSRFGLETGKPWLAYSWLFEASVYLSHQLFGVAGIFLFRLVMVLAVAVAVHRMIAKRIEGFAGAAALFAAAMFALGPLMTERPWLFTILFVTLILDMLLDLAAGASVRKVWYLPLMFALWANLHIQFVYGLLVLGLACAGPVGDHLLGKQAAQPTICRAGSRAWWSLVLVTALCFLATFCNPYGWQVYGVVLEFGTQKTQMVVLSELQPLGFRDIRDFVVPALGGLALFSLGKRQRWTCFEVLLLIVAGWFSLRTRRDLWFLTLSAVAVLASAGAQNVSTPAFLPTRRQAMALAGLLGLLLGLGWHWQLQGEIVQAKLAADYPVDAVRFVKTTGCRGPLYNHFDWGGYLIWSLPELPVSMDGRSNFHGDARLAQNYVTCNGLPGWEQDPDLAVSQVVIADVSTPLAAALRTDPRFELAYEDERALVFVVDSRSDRLARK
jgi:hypothetical protein